MGVAAAHATLTSSDVDVATLASLPPIGKLGRYELLGRLAIGGMAEIFLAREVAPEGAHRELVVKRVLPHVANDEQHGAMFAQEAKLSLRLRHPNICSIYEFAEQDGRFYLAMEWVRGLSLRNLVDRVGSFEGGLPVPIAAHLIAQIAGALHHAHTATDERNRPLNIVHRDVTPENIIVGFDGVPKLIDFGVAKSAAQLQKTEAGTVKGKFAYMSPEQYRGEPLDGRADIFALGCCLYEAITADPLYARASEYETVAAITLDPTLPSIRDANPDFPEELDRIVQRALAKDRNERFESAAALETALVDFLASRGDRARASDVAKLMEEAAGDELRLAPPLDRTALYRPEPSDTETPSTEQLALAADMEEVEETLHSRARRKRAVILLTAALVVAGTLGASLYALTQGPSANGNVEAAPSAPGGSR
jgi:serine/threonine-protein kinase